MTVVDAVVSAALRLRACRMNDKRQDMFKMVIFPHRILIITDDKQKYAYLA